MSSYGNPQEIVERVLLAIERRQSQNFNPPPQSYEPSTSDAHKGSRNKKFEIDGGELTRIELQQLGMISSLKYTTCSAEKCGWSSIEVELITQLTHYLQTHVASASKIDFYNYLDEILRNTAASNLEELFKESDMSHKMSIVRRGLESSSILLSIITFPGIDRRVIIEDTINSCISLFRQYFCINITPSLQQDTNRAKGGTISNRKRRKVSNNTNNDTTYSTNSKIVEAAAQKICKMVLTTVGNLSFLMEQMERLVITIAIDDQPLLSLTSACLSSYTIEPAQSNVALCHLLQLSASALICAVFQRYRRHRRVIIEDLFPLFLKLPTSKKSMRTFSLSRSRIPSTSLPTSKLSSSNVNCQGYIQMISHLLLILVQSCVVIPSPIEKRDEDSKGKEKYTLGTSDSRNVVEFLVSQILQRCARKGSDGGASEFRPILANLVDDLLLVNLNPEYPAADLILTQICQYFGKDLIRLSSNAKVNMEPTYLNTAADILGKICCSAAGVLKSHRESPLRMPQAIKIENENDMKKEENTNKCVCGRTNFVNTFMLDCDRCHGWFHGNCVGVTKDNLPPQWFCDDCTMLIMITEETVKFSKRRAESNQVTSAVNEEIIQDEKVDQLHIFRQLLLNSFVQLNSANNESNLNNAANFMICSFIEHIDGNRNNSTIKNDLLIERYLQQWGLNLAQNNVVKCSEEGNTKLMKTLSATTSGLAKTFPQVLGVFVRLLSDDNVSLRKIALKALSQILKVDSTLMLQSRLKKAVNLRFLDDAISVREAVVNLVGNYVLLDPAVANAYHSSLLSRLNDVGVSVRKRSVKIFHDILLSQPDYEGKVEACTKMLSRAADTKEDDNVRDLIFETFQDLWFHTGKKPRNENNIENSVAGKTSNPNYNPAMQMIAIVEESGSPDFLSTFVKHMMFGVVGNDKEKKVQERLARVEEAKAHCTIIVNSIIEHLLSFEEKRSNFEKTGAGNRLVAIISTLEVFAHTVPGALVQHLDTLIIYLKFDNGVGRDKEAQIVTYVSKIFSLTISELKKSDIQRLGSSEFCPDLEKITYVFGSTTINSAVEALSILAKYEDDIESNHSAKKTLMKLTSTFYKFLHNFVKKDSTLSISNPKLKNNFHRALSVLGAICRFCSDAKENLHEDSFQNQIILEPPAVSSQNVLASCFALVTTIMKKFGFETKCAALKALSGILVAYPKAILSLEQMGIMREVMVDDADDNLKCEALYCWKEVLVAEENRVESGEAKIQMVAKLGMNISEQISGDQDGDATLIGGVLNHYAERLQKLVLSKNSQVRIAALDLIGALLRQGLINPMQTVTCLFALQGDLEFLDIRSYALNLLVAEGEKRPDMLRQRFQAGIKHAFIFQNSLRTDSSLVTALIERDFTDEITGKLTKVIECIFGAIYKESICSNKTQRQSMFSNLVGLFYNLSQSEESLNKNSRIMTPHDSGKKKRKNVNDEELTNSLPLLMYVSEVLAHLPYESVCDPLFLIYNMNCVISLHGVQLLDAFSTLLGTDDVDNTHEDCLEIAVNRSMHRNSTEEISSLMKNVNLESFKCFSIKSSGLILLLRLKAFLKKVYNISDTKIIEYHPSQKHKIGEKNLSSSFSRNFPKFNSVLRFSGEKEGLDNMIAHYVEFRRLMRSTDSIFQGQKAKN